MAGGKSDQIKNTTNMQVKAYSKRSYAIFKKAEELTALCDAEVSIVMVSNTGKVHEFISPHTTIKDMYDDYQKTLDIDVWTPLHDRNGEQLQDLNFEKLVHLGEQITDSLDIVTNRKHQVMARKANTSRKKVTSMINTAQKLKLRVSQEHVKNIMDKGAKLLLQQYQKIHNLEWWRAKPTAKKAAAFDKGTSINMYGNLHIEGSHGFQDLRLASAHASSSGHSNFQDPRPMYQQLKHML